MLSLSNEWLSSVLSMTVVSFSVETVQEGISTGHLKVLEIQSASGTTTKLVLKETRIGSQGKELSRVLGLPRETFFYNQFAAKLSPTDVARAFYSQGDFETGESTLLMEDLSAGIQSGYFFGAGNPMNWGKNLDSLIANQKSVAARDVAEAAFLLAARLHATFWCSKDLLGPEWLKGSKWVSGEDASGWLAAQTQTKNLWDSLKSKIKNKEAEVEWSTQVVDVIEASVKKAAGETAWPDLQARMKARPWTLLHGDFHPGNMIYMPAPPEAGSSGCGSLKLIDWEMVGVGSGPQDLAQYMISHATPALRHECEKTLLARYHQELTAALNDQYKASYTLEQCEAEYVSGGVGKWVWLLVQMGGGMAMPAPVMQFFHDQFAAFLTDHKVTPDSDAVPPPRV